MLLLLLDSCIWFFSRELLLHMETEENPVSCSLNGNEVDEEYSLSLNLQTNNDVIDGGEGGGEKEEGGMIMIPPTIGMAFQSFDEARDFYKQYAVQKGFETKIKSSWSRKKTKEKYSALLTCSCEGFKETKEDALYRRQDIRVGCKAHMRVKLLKSNKWEVISVHLDHNHECSPSLSRRCRSHRLVESGSKRIRKLTSCSNPIKKRTVNMKRFELNSDAGMQLNKPFIVGAVEPPNLSFEEKDVRNHVDNHKQSILGEGDAEVLHNYFTHMQQKNSNFFYLMDLDKEGRLKNVFWAHARSRTAYGYFGDVVTFDTTYLTNRYDLRFASFVGVNHHGQSVLLGCCLLGDQSTETFIWVFQAWLTCMSGCPPNAIITEQCIAIQIAISKVFPRTRHRLCLWHIMKKIPEKLGKLSECKAIKKTMKNIVYDSLRVDEFEGGWTNMIEQYGLVDIEWLRTLCKLRQLWVPVYVKDIFFAGMSTTRRKESPCSFFDGYVDAKTSLKEFIERYDSALSEKYEKEAQADFESVYIDPFLKTSCCFEGQIAKLYTRGMFLKFQDEVYSMASCSKSRLRVDGSFITYLVKERIIDKAGKRLEPKVYEVLYNVSKVKVRCICRLFEYRGILCKHSLCVLNEFVDEIPSQYILSRWTKDFQRKYVLDHVSNNTDVRTPVQRHVALYQNAIQIVDEGVISDSSYKVVLQELQELKKKVQRLNNVSSDIENNACEGTETNVMQTTTQPNTIGCTEVLDPLQVSRVEQTTENRFQSCLAQSSFQTTANFEDHHVMHGRSYITGCFDPTSAFRVHNQVHTASTTLTTRDFGIHGTAQAEGTE